MVFKLEISIFDTDWFGTIPVAKVLVKGTVGGDDTGWDFKLKPELPNSQLDEFYWQSPHKQIFEDFRARVVKVHDGDTMTLRCSFRDFDFPIRLLEIDTKEMNAGGARARDWVRNRLENQFVDVIMNPKERTEKWGRLLGKVRHSGVDIGDTLMRMGLAVPFEQRNEEQLPNINKELSTEKWF